MRINLSRILVTLIIIISCSFCDESIIFKNLKGPLKQTFVAKEKIASWQKYSKGSTSRLAILLTDPNSSWLGLAHGLKTLGLPFLITDKIEKAVNHSVVLVYPVISGKVLSKEKIQTLVKFIRKGGTVITFKILGGGINKIFGFEKSLASKSHYKINLNTNHDITRQFTDKNESTIVIGSNNNSGTTMGSFSFSNPKNKALGMYENGAPAIIYNQYGKGKTYAFGLDIGFLIQLAYNNREEGVARNYVNNFEPTIDVLLTMIKNIFVNNELNSVILSSVPGNKSLTTIITHDVDYHKSLENSIRYAQLEKELGIPATYFIQTHYVKDYNDKIYFNHEGVKLLNQLKSFPVEIASHSVAHSSIFAKLPLGSGREYYPNYRPKVINPEITLNATILGELRVSKFLLDNFIKKNKVVSFRPGELSNPYSLPQALEASNYLYSSSVTANNSLTHLPFQLNYDRNYKSETKIFEFPITIEDEQLPTMDERLNHGVILAKKISRYKGLCVVLIHTNILSEKYDFEKNFVKATKNFSWFASIRDFGNWWAARNEIELDVKSIDQGLVITLDVPQSINNLTLCIPDLYKYISHSSNEIIIKQEKNKLLIKELIGKVNITIKKMHIP